jgi:glycosyltransferase involved in cell wall biosynthesis
VKKRHNRHKILLLVKSLGLGGAERLLVDSLAHLDRQRFDYHLGYMLPWKDLLVPHFIDAGIPVHNLGTVRERQPANYKPTVNFRTRAGNVAALLAFVQLVRLHRQEHFDLIHADLPVASFAARLLSRLDGVPVVYTEHNLQERYHPLTRWANRTTYGWNRHVFAVSEEVMQSIRRAGMDQTTQVETLLNGIPVEQIRAEATDLAALRQELQIPADHTVIGTVAVFRRQKRLLDWVTVAAQVVARHPQVTFLLVGDGPEMAEVRAQIQALKLEDRIRLPGFRADGRRLMGLMDIYLMTSEHEGLPIALLEAMALAKPVVATAAGGIPEVVRSGKEGLLAPVGAIEDLVDHLLRLLASPEEQRCLGQAGAAQIDQRFHIQHRVRNIEERYLSILGKTLPVTATPSSVR